jgi:hypothetical protein
MVGIPYAQAGVTGTGAYFVVCPRCGLHCFAGPKRTRRTEDTETKDAARTYALHWEEVHAPDADR